MDMDQASPPVRYLDDGGPIEFRYVLLWLPSNPDALKAGAWQGRRIANMGEARLVSDELGKGDARPVAAVSAAVYSDGLVVLLSHSTEPDFIESGPLHVHVYAWDVATFVAFGIAFPELDRPVASKTVRVVGVIDDPRENTGDGEMTGRGMIITTRQGPATVAICDLVLTRLGWLTVSAWEDAAVVARLDLTDPPRWCGGLRVASVVISGQAILWHIPCPNAREITHKDYREWRERVIVEFAQSATDPITDTDRMKADALADVT